VSGSRIIAAAWAEASKLGAQFKLRLVLAICVAGPFAFVAAMKVQSSLPEDTLFGRAVKDTGFATPLVILGFAGLWLLPALTSIVAGDLFSAEDRYGTWTTVLTRSCTRNEVFSGKVLVAFAFSLLAVMMVAAGSFAAGLLGFGAAPLIDLSGALVPPARAFREVALAWVSVFPPALAFTAIAMLFSVATRSSAAGVGVPVVLGLVMELAELMDGPDAYRRLLLTSSFGAWHGIVTEHPYYGPLVHGIGVSALYTLGCVIAAHRILRARDIAG
jgi:ABC-2 type transport system permease protein